MAPFRNHLANLLRARFPYLYIHTWEEERVLRDIHDVVTSKDLIKTPRTLFTWSVTTGLVGGSREVTDPSRSPLKVLEFIEQCSEPAVLVLKDFHVFLGAHNRPQDHEVVRKIRDIAVGLRSKEPKKNVILLSPILTLPDELQKEVTIVNYALPELVDIRMKLRECVAANKAAGKITIELSSEDEERLAKAALGLTLQEAENAFALAIAQDGRLDGGSIGIVHEEKRQIIRKSGLLEYVQPEVGIADVGGLQNLKRWLTKRNKSWLESAARYRLPAPKGVLITGVPGCGKSLTAKAVSSMWQLPLLKLDIGKIFAGIVGSSEENMRRAIQVAEAVAPSILYIDEIEKGFSGTSSSGDSGTSARVFGTFLTWMQEKTKAVFVIATANSIESLPPELLRKGRFDEIFFVDLPTLNERRDILKLHMERRLKDLSVVGDFRVTDAVLLEFAKATEGFVGSEIEQLVVTALFDAFADDRSIRRDDLDRAIRNTVPLSVTQAERIMGLRQWANTRAVAAADREDLAPYAAAADATPDSISASRGGRAVDF